MKNIIQTSSVYSFNTRTSQDQVPQSMYPLSDWSGVTKVKLQELIRLEHGWDGYRAVPVTFENAMFAYSMLESICRKNTPAPQIVPGISGNLQIEWHTNQGDIELLVKGPNKVLAWSLMGDDEFELELTNDFSIVSEWVCEITESRCVVGIEV